MAGVAIRIDAQSLERLQARLQRFAGLSLAELREQLGAVVESQTRRRIADEKTAPDGGRWDNWSEAYAGRRHGGHSLLQGEGALLDSIGYAVDGDEVLVGTHLKYGAIHQFGGDAVGMAIPARPFLGLSAANEDELLAVLDDWLDSEMERL